MKEKKLFLVAKIVVFIPLFSLILMYLSNEITYKIFLSILIAIVLDTLNFTGAITSIKISYRKKGKSAIKSYIIGTAIRLPLFFASLIFALMFLDISVISLIFSVLIFYMFFLIIEIMYLNIEK